MAAWFGLSAVACSSRPSTPIAPERVNRPRASWRPISSVAFRSSMPGNVAIGSPDGPASIRNAPTLKRPVRSSSLRRTVASPMTRCSMERLPASNSLGSMSMRTKGTRTSSPAAPLTPGARRTTSRMCKRPWRSNWASPISTSEPVRPDSIPPTRGPRNHVPVRPCHTATGTPTSSNASAKSTYGQRRPRRWRAGAARLPRGRFDASPCSSARWVIPAIHRS